MITNFNNFTGIFKCDINGNDMFFNLYYDEKETPFKVFLINKNNIYDKISIEVPDTEKLDTKEFFMDYKTNKNIIRELINQNFIQLTNKSTVAGDKTVHSYKIIL
jgi:hypothetical protein